jgi:hypothetical protein
VLIAGLLLLTGVAILALAMSSSNAANKDFVTYWAAGRQHLHHANPYDGAEILRLEREPEARQTATVLHAEPANSALSCSAVWRD